MNWDWIIALSMWAVMAGCDPTIMGIGPVYAVRKVLDRLGMTLDDMDVVELNEAFASQAMAVIKELGLEDGFPLSIQSLGAPWRWSP